MFCQEFRISVCFKNSLETVRRHALSKERRKSYTLQGRQAGRPQSADPIQHRDPTIGMTSPAPLVPFPELPSSGLQLYAPNVQQQGLLRALQQCCSSIRTFSHRTRKLLQFCHLYLLRAILLARRTAGNKLLATVNLLSSLRFHSCSLLYTYSLRFHRKDRVAPSCLLLQAHGCAGTPPITLNARLRHVCASARACTCESSTPIWRVLTHNATHITLPPNLLDHDGRAKPGAGHPACDPSGSRFFP